MNPPLPSFPSGLRRWLFGSAALVVLATSALHSEQEVPLWEGTPPGLRHTKSEASEDRRETGRSDRYISYVSTPTLTLYPAPGVKGANVTILVVPGGGFRYVCIDKEGIEVAQWLNSIGISAVVLKYHTSDPDKPRNAETIEPLFADLGRAMKVLRTHARDWGVDPIRLGVMGFSAGGIMAIHLVAHAQEENAGAADPIEKQSNRPDFVAIIYGSVPPGKPPVPNKSWPPFFIAHAADDPKAPAPVMVKAFEALQQAGGSAEIHVFNKGDHGFGVSPKSGAVRSWTTLFANWLSDIGMTTWK